MYICTYIIKKLFSKVQKIVGSGDAEAKEGEPVIRKSSVQRSFRSTTTNEDFEL